MKKNIKQSENKENLTEKDLKNSNTSIAKLDDDQEGIVESANKPVKKAAFSISFFTMIGIIFLVFLIIGVTVRFVFPYVDSLEAGINNKKSGKSIVFNYFNLIQNSNYDEALKLLDVVDSNFTSDSLMNTIKNQFGTTNIVDFNVLDVLDNNDYSVVNTVISYVKEGVVKTKKQSMIIKNTPKGWKISLDGVVKRFDLDPVTVTFDKNLGIRLEQIDYCVEGINLKLQVKNSSYDRIDMNGTITLSTTTGKYTESVDTVLKPKVSYEHNIMFNSAVGEPISLHFKSFGKNKEERTLPVVIRR